MYVFGVKLIKPGVRATNSQINYFNSNNIIQYKTSYSNIGLFEQFGIKVLSKLILESRIIDNEDTQEFDGELPTQHILIVIIENTDSHR